MFKLNLVVQIIRIRPRGLRQAWSQPKHCRRADVPAQGSAVACSAAILTTNAGINFLADKAICVRMITFGSRVFPTHRNRSRVLQRVRPARLGTRFANRANLNLSF